MGRLIDLAGQVGRDRADDSDTALRKRVAVLLFAGTVPLTVGWAVIYLLAGVPLAASLPVIYSVVTPLNTALFAATRNLRFYRFTQLLMILLLPSGVMLSLGGFSQSSAVVVWAALSPLTALLIEDLRKTVAWAGAFILILIASALIETRFATPPLSPQFVTAFFVLNIGVVISVVFALLYYFVAQRDYFYQRSETLLLNILPREVSEALKSGRRTIAADYESASILFADVVGFTPMSSTMTPLQLVDLLNEVFLCFDALIERYDVEKIKTIGDCCMVAAGVPRPRPDHAEALVALALDMLGAIETQSFAGRRLAVRIGINSGPVVAGVIGRKKFIYDLWGDAVNIASRMESHGESGKIQVTRATYELIRGTFLCEARGRIKVKGADEIEVWHVLGRNPADVAGALVTPQASGQRAKA